MPILFYYLIGMYYYVGMNEAGVESGAKPERRKSESSTIEDDAYRMKVATLRDGARRVLREHEILLEPGVSNPSLLDILSQVVGDRGTMVTYTEDLSSDWSDEYRRIVEQIAVIISHPEFGVQTEPHDIVRAVEENLAA